MKRVADYKVHREQTEACSSTEYNNVITAVRKMVTWIILFLVLLTILFICIKFYLSPPTRWCRSQRCLVGKTVLVTGANTGIGYEAALDFAKRGAKVILACRDSDRGETARGKIIEQTDNPNIFVKLVDFASLTSIRTFAKELNETEDRLDILVNNAGISFADDTRTIDGINKVMQVNHYSPFLLTHLLLDLMKKTGEPGRIVNVSSLAAAHANRFDVDSVHSYDGNLAAYANSKLCNILFTKELARRLSNTKLTTFSVHPGAIKTEIFRTSKGYARHLLNIVVALFYKPVEDGAQTTLYCSLEKGIEEFNGSHFDNCRRVADYRTATVPGLPRKLWEISEDIVHLKKQEKLEDF